MQEYFKKYYAAEQDIAAADKQIKEAELKKYNSNSAMTKIKRDLLSNGIKVADFKAQYAKWKAEQCSC